MGRVYARDKNGHAVLCCDACGQPGGVRRRTCPHTILMSAMGTQGRMVAAACAGPDLCGRCYAARKATLHDGCAERAATIQAREDALQARYEQGEPMVRAGYGDWDARVPAGQVGVLFVNAQGDETFALLPKADYDHWNKPGLSDYPQATIISVKGEAVHA